MKINFRIRFAAAAALIILPLSFAAAAQEVVKQPTPTPADEPIKIYTEEVHLNVTAQTRAGKFVSTLAPDDLLVVESGTPQKIESMKRTSASVLVLLDTGGNLNFAKSLQMSRLTAKLFVAELSPDDAVAVMQSYDKIETVTGWTADRAQVQDDLDHKLFAGRRSRFADSIAAAVEMFKSRPAENRHLVFIGDGLDSFAGEPEREKALRDLLAANVTVHVIAYNQMEAARARPMTRRVQVGEERETPRIPDDVLEEIVQSMPKSGSGSNNMADGFKRFAKAERLFVIRLDGPALKLAKQKLEQWTKSEAELRKIAEDTGGMFQAPEETVTMWTFARDVARAVDSQYVVTYVPTKSFADDPGGGERKVRVGTHCDGVVIRSRQKVVAYKTVAK